MKYSVEQEHDEIVVTIEDAEGREKLLLEAVHNCGKAVEKGCTVECGKIASLEECQRNDTVVLRLVPLPGEHLEASSVKRCLQILWKQPCG